MNDRIVRPEARALLNGTSGRPAIVGTMHDENGRIVVVYADGCMAVRALRPETQFSRDLWVWEPMEGPCYEDLFTTVDAAPAAVPVPLADAPEPTNGLHPSYCECPFPAPKRGNMICSTCEGWLREMPQMDPCKHGDCRFPNPVGMVVCRECNRSAR